MSYKTLKKPAITLIGKVTPIKNGSGQIAKAWGEVSSNLTQLAPLIKYTERGKMSVWGAMTDSDSSLEWQERFEIGLFLAGVECIDSAEAPEGWAKWVLPESEYVVAPRSADITEVCDFIEASGMRLSGGICDHTEEDGRAVRYYPVERR